MQIFPCTFGMSVFYKTCRTVKDTDFILKKPANTVKARRQTTASHTNRETRRTYKYMNLHHEKHPKR